MLYKKCKNTAAREGEICEISGVKMRDGAGGGHWSSFKVIDTPLAAPIQLTGRTRAGLLRVGRLHSTL